MTIKFHEKKRQYIDNMGFILVKEIKVLPIEKTPTSFNKEDGYLKHKKIFDLSDKIIGPMSFSRTNFEGKLFEKYVNINEHKIGLDKIGLDKIYTLTSTILKDNELNKVISEEFLINSIFEWIISTYRKEAKRVLSDYILNECVNNILDYNIYIPILYLESDREFYLGKVHFLYISEEYINKLSLKVEEKRRDEYVKTMNLYKGRLMGNCPVIMEKGKAISSATKQIILSVDVLRILSPTVEFPDFKIYFDVDYRNIHQSKNEVITQPLKEEQNFLVTHTVIPQPFEIVQSAWDIMCKIGIVRFHEFIDRTVVNKTELEKLIHVAIGNFSKAIATHDLHERIVQIFSVLESLLLADESSPILDSVTKYLPKLISVNVEERKKIIAIVKELYKVRSNMVHHANKKDFDKQKLSLLQIYNRSLILRLIEKSIQKKSKNDILKEIDDIIISA